VSWQHELEVQHASVTEVEFRPLDSLVRSVPTGLAWTANPGCTRSGWRL